MGRLIFAPFIFGVAATVMFAVNPVDVQAVPVTTANSEISFGDLDIQGKIIHTTTEEVASPFYKKGISIAADCVMIRKAASVESEAVGKLYANAGFEVIEETGEWIYFDYVPGESNVRTGKADVTGKICVIGSKLNEENLHKLFLQ